MSLSGNNLIATLQARSQSAADRVAYRFIEEEHEPVRELTYGALHRQALCIAAALREHCDKGDRVLMMYHSSREFIPAFFGCMYAGVIAVPAYPPRKNHNALRLLSIIEDAGVRAVLSTVQVHRQIRAMDGYGPVFEQAGWINTDEVKDIPTGASVFTPEIVHGDEVMFLQYTSGSTGKPKGVIVTHENMWANLAMLYEALEVNDDSVYVSWLPYFHDMGLIGVILEAMYAGVPAVMMNPAYFLQKPIRWLQAISTYGGTVSGAPNFAYDLCVDKIREEDLEGIDLRTWQVAFNGAEPVSAKTLERFYDRFKQYGFSRRALLPSFGLAEATLFVSAQLDDKGPRILPVDQSALLKGIVMPAGKEDARVDMVSCGKTWHGHELAIVDPVTKERCAAGCVGELWFKGKSVARGYWNKPVESKEVFDAYISNDGPYLRTGDLAFLSGDDLYITGRLKDVLVIRGGNYYPQDLELTTWESHPHLIANSTAAFTIDTETGTQLVIVQEVQRTAVRDLQAGNIFEAIISRIASEYQLQVFDIVLLSPGNILKTSSGKIQRQANRQAYLDAGFKPLGQWRHRGMSTYHQPEEGVENEYSNRHHELENWIRERISELTELPVDRIHTDKDFSSFGLDSVGAVQLSGALQTHLGTDVSPGLVYDYPSISLLVQYLLPKDKGRTKNTTAAVTDNDQDIAIIGMSGRFPGAKDLGDFEQLLFGGQNMVTTPGIDAPVDGNTRHVTYRSGYMPDVDLFDAGFFEIAPKEAKSVDPQQRLLLELCYTAMQHAGYAPQTLKGTSVGVFVGISNFDYAQLSLKHVQHKTAYFGTGVALSIAANRVSYFFDFKGPSLCIDTACSSSLVAVHQAVRSIRSGESTMALAGGVNLILSDTVNEYLDAGKLLAQDGHCKTFDESADGYVRGEGAGVLLLKSKMQAIEDNDEILAIIKGSAVVQDGHSNGLLAPNGVSQQQVLQNALADARVQPASVLYVEAHGTGTALGDPIEVSALDKVFGTDRDKDAPLIIGSVKANIGHLESAAGIAGLIKTIICLRRKQVPKQVHFKKHNPNISWDKLCVQVPTAVLDIKTAGQPLRAGVSSFGFGGTNAHVVLEGYVAAWREQVDTNASPLPYRLVVLSAKTEEALAAQVASLAGFMSQHDDLSLDNLAYSLANTRDHFLHRLAVKCSSIRELSNILKEIGQGEENNLSVVRTEPGALHGRKAFLFTGGGAQYAGMTAALYASQPVFKAAIDQCVALANRWLEADLEKILFATPGTAEEALLHRIDYMQPALFAYEYAMSRLWMSWGVMPDVLIGHSLGEIVAACVAGVFDLEDGIKLICSRGRLMQGLPPGGVMISLQANEAEVIKVIDADAHAVSVAVINGPDQTVIAGEKNAAERIKKTFDERGVKTKTLQVSHASHSVLMDPILEQYGEVLASITFRKPSYTLISNATGKEADAAICTVQYWVDHLRDTVRFSSGIQQLEALGVRTFIEVGPHPVLLGIAKECMDANESASWLPSARSTDPGVLYDSLVRFYVAGGNVDWKAFYKEVPAQKITLPTYPFQRESYWIDTTASVSAQYHTYSGKPLLGHRIDVAGDAVVYESVIDLQNFSYLADHKVMGMLLVPASFFCDMVQAYIAARGHTGWEIEEILFEKPLMPEAGRVTRVQLLVRKEQEHRMQCSIHSFHEEDAGESWSVLVQGTICLPEAEENIGKNFADVQKRYTGAIPVQELYEDFAAKGMEYGACFQPVTDIYINENSVLGKIVLPHTIAETETTGYELHPVLLDGSFQLLNALAGDSAHAYLPFSVEGYKLAGNASGTIWAELTLQENSTGNEIVTAAITLWNEQGEQVGHIQQLSVKKADASLFNNQVRHDYQYHLDWKPIWPELEKNNKLTNEKWLVIASNPAAVRVSAFVDVLVQRGAAVTLSHGRNTIADIAVNKIVCFWDRAYTGDIAGESTANALVGLAQLQESISFNTKNTGTKPDGYWWVTEGAHQFLPGVIIDPSLATVCGLGRVFMREHQDIAFKLLDVVYGDDVKDTAVALVNVISSKLAENELALNNAHLYALRLVAGLQQQEAVLADRQLVFSDQGFDSLSFDPVPGKKPGATEVEIRVKYAGLNFRDIFRVLGLIANDTGDLGGECSGVIVSVGSSVEGLKPGDEVMALAEGSFANVVTTDYRLVVKKPVNLSLREAATIPIAFLTAWYGFKNLADIQPGEKVLVHSAAGGVGMAAIQIVHYLGGKVYGTASHAKWEAVRKLGVTHVYDSRTLDFYQQVLTDTDGKGVDVVLNSFIDKFIDRSLDLLSDGGRFLEIGKRDIRKAENIAESHIGVAYAAYDLIYLMQNQQELIGEMFACLVPLFEHGTFHPLPVKAFDMQNARDAFQFMSKAKHVGKVILTIPGTEEQAAAVSRLSSRSTVLITGGLGGLGLQVAHYLVKKYKVAHLLLIGRKAPLPEVIQELQKLEQAGTLITTRSVDVTDHAALAGIIDTIPAEYPLKGVLHLAGMLDDAAIAEQDDARFTRTMAPKINGAWNLHELTKDRDLELFVLFSSAASVLGSAGQSNYAAANAFLDSLAYYRNGIGLPACSISWGPWEATGLVHRLGNEHKKRIRKQGIGLLSNEEGIALLDDVLERNGTQPVLLPILKSRLAEMQSASPYPLPSLFKDLLDIKKNETVKKEPGAWTRQLASLNSKQREQFLVETLQQEVARILSVPDAKKIHLDKSLQEFGMDSLMAVELRNKLSVLVGKKLPVTLLFDYPNVLALATFLDKQIGQQGPQQDVSIEIKKKAGWRETIYQQLLSELKETGDDGQDYHKAVHHMLDELDLMMSKTLNGNKPQEANELDGLSLEELEHELENELRDI